jgi:hypothetical protein
VEEEDTVTRLEDLEEALEGHGVRFRRPKVSGQVIGQGEAMGT